MEILNLIPGTNEWKATRLTHFTASEAAAMMGASPHMSRDQLLTYKKSKIEEEVNYFTQKIFDDGHALEALARAVQEAIDGDEYYPVVGSLEVEGLDLLASMDGLNMGNTFGWEHKQWNAEKAAKMEESQEILGEYTWQLEHQSLVSGAEAIKFVMSDGTEENRIELIYTSDPIRRTALIAGWHQFAKDLEDWVPPVYKPKAVARAMPDLPALRIEATGEITTSNIDNVLPVIDTFLDQWRQPLESDEDYATAENVVKALDQGEKQMEMVKKQVLSQTQSIEDVINTLERIKKDMKTVRLSLGSQVKEEKERRKRDIKERAEADLAEYIKDANAILGSHGVKLPLVVADFAAAMRSKRTIESLNSGVNDELARCKIEINRLGEAITANLDVLSGVSAEHQHLFSQDKQALVEKGLDDLVAIIDSRIMKAEQAQRDAEAARVAAEKDKDEGRAEYSTDDKEPVPAVVPTTETQVVDTIEHPMSSLDLASLEPFYIIAYVEDGNPKATPKCGMTCSTRLESLKWLNDVSASSNTHFTFYSLEVKHNGITVVKSKKGEVEAKNSATL